MENQYCIIDASHNQYRTTQLFNTARQIIWDLYRDITAHVEKATSGSQMEPTLHIYDGFQGGGSFSLGGGAVRS